MARKPNSFYATDPDLDTHELAWAAGFFDGEGCTYAARNRKDGPASITLEITQVDRDVLERFRVAVGGVGEVSGPSYRARKKIPKAQGSYRWRANANAVVLAVLRRMWPRLSEPKRRQAQAAFDAFLSSRGRAIEPFMPDSQTGRQAKMRQGVDVGKPPLPKWRRPHDPADEGNDPTALPGQRKLPGMLAVEETADSERMPDGGEGSDDAA